jgi:CelD/BcsL family acetyltransferase involved in cellulose biosynthesis
MRTNWTLHALAELHQQAKAWDELNAKAANIPFLEARFLLPLVQEFATTEPRLALCRDASGVLVAGALLERVSLVSWQTFQPSQLPLGAWLVDPALDTAQLGHGLLSALGPLALRLGLSQLDPQLCPRPQDSATLSTLDYIETAWVDIEGNFDDYWEARGKNLRTNMRKHRSKLEADGITMQFDRITAPEFVAAAIAEYGRLETASWKAGMGTAVHSDNAQGRFYNAMMRNFCEAGRGEIWRLRFGDQVVAMDLCICAGSNLVILKTAFDPSFRNVSPAFLLKQEAFKQLFDEGRMNRIEFYGRMMEWHTRWTNQLRTLYHLNCDRWSWLRAMQTKLKRHKNAAPDSAPKSVDEQA